MIENTTRRGMPTAERLRLADLAARATVLAIGRERILIGLAGAPGAGKSTLASALVAELGDRSVVVEMDGFHLADAQLRRAGLRERKGAPDTFDVAGFDALLHRLRTESATEVYAPRFDRALEEPIAGAIRVHPGVDVVIVEGNYLLHDDDAWRGIAEHFTETWFLEVPEATLTDRLIARRQSFGEDAEAAADWVREVDGRNADLVVAGRSRADRVVELDTLLPATVGGARREVVA